jgi:hypothetical protein
VGVSLGNGDRQHQFEKAVARRFTLGRFQADAFRVSHLADGVDHLAHVPGEEHCPAVESTTHANTADGKLSKLVARTFRLHRAVAPSVLTPVVVTSLLADEVATPD